MEFLNQTGRTASIYFEDRNGKRGESVIVPHGHAVKIPNTENHKLPDGTIGLKKETKRKLSLTKKRKQVIDLEEGKLVVKKEVKLKLKIPRRNRA